MNRLSIYDVILCACVVITFSSMIGGYLFTKSHEIKLEQMRNEHKLKEYELMTERTEVYIKALEAGYSSELVNEWGEVYSR